MKKLLLAILVLGNLTVLHAEEKAVGEVTSCDTNDEKCCERVASGKKQVDGAETVVAPKAEGTEATDK